MSYIIIPLLVLLSLRPLSCAKYNWNKKQYLQAVGMVVIVMAMLIFPVFALIAR